MLGSQWLCSELIACIVRNTLLLVVRKNLVHAVIDLVQMVVAGSSRPTAFRQAVGVCITDRRRSLTGRVVRLAFHASEVIHQEPATTVSAGSPSAKQNQVLFFHLTVLDCQLVDILLWIAFARAKRIVFEQQLLEVMRRIEVCLFRLSNGNLTVREQRSHVCEVVMNAHRW